MRVLLVMAATITLLLGTSGQTIRADELVKAGAFYDGPHAPQHRVSGRAEVIKRDDGRHVLSLSDFVSDAGPDVYIILSSARKPRTDVAIRNSDYVLISVRKALTGDQQYELPPDIDPARYHSVGVWCQQYTVMFGAAALRRE